MSQAQVLATKTDANKHHFCQVQLLRSLQLSPSSSSNPAAPPLLPACSHRMPKSGNRSSSRSCTLSLFSRLSLRRLIHRSGNLSVYRALATVCTERWLPELERVASVFERARRRVT